MNFHGQTVLVTGASRGLGKAFAKLFAENGADVIGTASSIGSFPPDMQDTRFFAVDLSKPAELQSFLKHIEALPRLDVLVNNAGINIIKPLAYVTPEDYSAVLDVDLRAPYLLAQAAAAKMKVAGYGKIVNIASIWSVVTRAHRTLYSAAKSGLVGLTRALAAELAPDGILVNSVSPGFVLTDLTRQSLTNEELEQLSLQIPLRRMASPQEIAEVVAFLCSQKNSYLTGQNITVDGGFSII